MNQVIQTTKVILRPSLEEMAAILTDLLDRLDRLEKLGALLVSRCEQSSTTRVCLESLLPQIKELYPKARFTKEKTNGTQ